MVELKLVLRYNNNSINNSCHEYLRKSISTCTFLIPPTDIVNYDEMSSLHGLPNTLYFVFGSSNLIPHMLVKDYLICIFNQPINRIKYKVFYYLI